VSEYVADVVAVAAAVCEKMTYNGVFDKVVVLTPMHVLSWYAAEASGVPVHDELCGNRSADKEDVKGCRLIVSRKRCCFQVVNLP